MFLFINYEDLRKSTIPSTAATKIAILSFISEHGIACKDRAQTHMEVHAKPEHVEGVCVRPHVYRKAVSGYNSGWIVHAAIFGKRMEVKVRDRSTYQLHITESYNTFDYSCTCGDASVFYESCPHLIASLMHLMENFEMMLEEEANREEGAKYMLAHASSKQIADFLVKQMLEDPIMIDTFAREFGLCNVRLPRNYAREIDRMYSRIPKYGIAVTPIDFEPLFLEARSRQQGKEAPEATRMYQDMSASIRNHMKDVNDSDGYYADCCIEALENLVESVIRERLLSQGQTGAHKVFVRRVHLS